jgi:hypothetical protein
MDRRFLALLLISLANPAGSVALADTAASPAAAGGDDKAAITPVKDARAMAELKKMADALASARSLSFDAATMKPLRGPNDQWVHVFTTAKVALQRPDKLAITTGGDAFPERIVYDGKKLSIYSAESKLFTSKEMTGSIDDVLGHASEEAGLELTFSDVLLADPYRSWTDNLSGAVYVGESERGGEKLRHLAFTAKDVSWEVWVDLKSNLPRIVYAKFVSEKHAPSMMIEFSKWKVGAKLAASTFSFAPPKGTTRVGLKAPANTDVSNGGSAQ